MKHLIVISIFLISCTSNLRQKQTASAKDTIIKHDTVYVNPEMDTNWQVSFGLTHDPDLDSIDAKPLRFYLDNPKCAEIASDFYYGYFKPSDNGATAELLKYATSDDIKLRPFYRWCLSKTIEISDGSLSEYTGEPALRYVEKFPREFFEYMDEDTSGKRYQRWMGEISYSGFDAIDDKSKTPQIKKVLEIMRFNCRGCDPLILKRIEKFGKDCY